MLFFGLGATPALTPLRPSTIPVGPRPTPTPSRIPSLVAKASEFLTSPSRGQPGVACPSGWTFQGGVCISPGCISGQEKCVVVDSQKRQCSYDQMLAQWQATGIKQCPPPGGQQEESGHFVMPGTPGSSPIPGTQAMPSPLPLPGTINQDAANVSPQAVLTSTASRNKRLLWIGLGLAAIGGGIALLRR